MKVAILGAGPIGLRLAQKIKDEGAHVDIFSQGEDYTFFNYLKSSQRDSWLRDYQLLSGADEIKRFQVSRIQKELLRNYEVPGEKSRFWSLFRISCVKKTFSDEKMNLDFLPEKEARLIEEGLKKSVDVFFDYDVVVSSDEESFTPELEYGIINESHYQNKITQNIDFFKQIETLKKNQEITFVGNGVLLSQAILELMPWLDEDTNRVLNIVSPKPDLLSVFKTQLETEEYHQVDKEIHGHFLRWKKACEKYEEAVYQWRAGGSEDERPQEPLPQLRLYQHYSALSLDYLEDQNKMYLSCETSSFRDQSKQEVVIVSSDHLVVFNDESGAGLFRGLKMKYDSFGEVIREESGKCREKGVFFLDRKKSFLYSQVESTAQKILQEVLSLFQKVG